jgi:Fic family protein
MIAPRLFERIERKKSELDELRPLPAAAVRRLDEQLAIEWTYNSNAIEGSTLTLKETQLILETGLTIGGKSLREHLEAINHKEAIDYVESLARGEGPITPADVRRVHALVLDKIDDDNAGRYRKVPVYITGAAHRPPEPSAVDRLMNEWGKWVAGGARKLHSVERAAIAHHRLVSIHPFIDGNGRTARLVMNLLLMRDGYPPTIIERANRRQYYSVLAQADQGDAEPLVNLVARAVERGLTIYLEAVVPREKPPEPEDEWILLSEAAEGTPYSQESLSLLARLGRLEAVKRGRVWYSTRRAVEEYRASLE